MEMVMPLFGLAIGYGISSWLGGIMHILGALLLLAIGLWELLGEVREVFEKRQRATHPTEKAAGPIAPESLSSRGNWRKQLLLALSISLDELAVGFSLGAIVARTTSMNSISILVICALIGVQGFLMTIAGLTTGRFLRTSARWLKQWGEWLAALLLIGLGMWWLLDTL
jgi:putative Mn2+ efflux pump MntP